MERVYTAVLEPEDEWYNVRFPDLPGCYTCGKGLNDALYMAGDALNGWLTALEEHGEPIPDPTDDVKCPDGCLTTLVPANTDAYRSKLHARAVRKNVTVERWLAELADAHNINYSQTLQKALKAELGLPS